MGGGPRHQARRYAVLGLYQWQLTGAEPSAIRAQFFEDPHWMEALADALGAGKVPPNLDQALLQDLLQGVPEQCAALDRLLETALDRPRSQVTPVDLAVLRLGLYELRGSPGIHARVLLNEAVELAKEFGSTDDSHRYINGVLNRLARRLRPDELGGGDP